MTETTPIIEETADFIINHTYFIPAFQSEQELALAFSQRKPIYKFSSGYLYKYDEDKTLWETINRDDIISDLSLWITCNAQRLSVENINNKDIVDKLGQIIRKYTKYQYLKNVARFLEVFIKDDDFTVSLDRTLNDHLPIKNNKIINLRDGTVRYRTKEDKFTYFCNVEKTETESELFKDFISQIMCDNKENIKYLQKILGYCITGETSSQCFFIFYGAGSNGKSLLLKLLQKTLNKAYQPTSRKIFINSGRDAGPELCEIKNSRLLGFSETKKHDVLNDDIIKMITGNDKINARALYKDPISFSLISKLIMATNHKPNFDGNDAAMVRRINYVPFIASFVDNPILPNQYKINRDLEGYVDSMLNEFFTFCLNGAIEWYKNNQFEPPKKIKKEKDKYILSQNSINGWFIERVEAVEKGKLKRSDCFNDYMKFCDDNGITPVRKKDLFEVLQSYAGVCVKNDGIYIYKGFKLKKEEEEEENKNSLDL
jgi:putative DNA primase/helicase